MALLASISSAPPPAPPYVPDGEIVLNKNGVVASGESLHPEQAQRASTAKQMGLFASILTPVHVHAIRYGGAWEVAHLASSQGGAGLATNAIDYVDGSPWRGKLTNGGCEPDKPRIYKYVTSMGPKASDSPIGQEGSDNPTLSDLANSEALFDPGPSKSTNS